MDLFHVTIYFCRQHNILIAGLHQREHKQTLCNKKDLAKSFIKWQKKKRKSVGRGKMFSCSVMGG